MFVDTPREDERVREHYRRARAADGYVMNLERLWGWRPDVLDLFTAARTKLGEQTSLSPRERAVLVCATARALGDSYCALAWGKRLADATDAATAGRLLATGDAPALTARERALVAWTRRVVEDPNGTWSEDVAALRRAGLSEQEIVDATVFVAFRLAFATVNDALAAEPDAELVEAAPPEVRRAVTFGRTPATRR